MSEREPNTSNSITFEITEKKAYGYQDETITLKIPLDGELPPLQRETDYGNFGKPLGLSSISSFQELPAVTIKEVGHNMLQKEIHVVWVKERNEWVAFKYSWMQEDSRGSGDEYYSGPYTPDDYCLEKLLEAHNIPTNLSLDPYLGIGTQLKDLVKVSPQILKKLGERYNRGSYSIKFEGKDDPYYHYAVDWNCVLDKWQLSDQEYGSESERMRWFMGQDLEGSSKAQDAYHALLDAFGLTEIDVTFEEIIQMHPKKLTEIGTKDPVSHNIGDSRKASEVEE